MTTRQPRDLLLDEQLSLNEIRDLLLPVGLDDWQQAHRCLGRIPDSDEAKQALAASLPYLFTALANAAYPPRVLVNFERFVQNAPNRLDLLRYLARHPRTIEILVTLFAGSQFLTEILLRYPEYFEQITARKHLAELKTVEQLSAALKKSLTDRPDGQQDGPGQLDLLRRFQRQELLRIGAYDLLDLFDLPTVTTQLSHLADSLVQAGLTLAARQTQTDPAGFAVIGMGKLGGQELNYSSDIDLLFVAEANSGSYLNLSQQLIDILARPTGQGFLYRVDMRLRPWGRSGPLVSALEGHLAYLQKRAGLWEKQAMLKARFIAGDEAVGQAFLERARALIFKVAGPNIRADVRAMKERIEAQLRRQGNSWGEVKLGQGSIRDIEFVTQYLQLIHGKNRPRLQSRNTLEALAGLSAADLLSTAEYRVLADGYIFLRTVEHHLQLMHYHQTHLLPDNAAALTHLARRLRFQGPEAGDQFVARYQEHSAAIRAVYRRYLEEADEIGGETVSKDQNPGNKFDTPPTYVARHIVQMPPAYGTTFSESEIEHHSQLVARLDRNNPIKVEAVRLNQSEQNDREDLWRVTIVGYDYVGQLSLICGLLFIYGFNIIDGHVFSYGRDQEAAPSERGTRRRRGRRRSPALKAQPQPMQRKIVDVFTIRSTRGQITQESWEAYADDLAGLTRQLHRGEPHQAQGELAKRVAAALREMAADTSTLYPVDIEIDNQISNRHTVLEIDAPDTIGFLYEFTNALALNGINIRHMTVDTVGSRVRDTLYVVDSRGQKITSPEKQRELRAATVLIKQFTHLLPRSPNPEAALLQFRQFIGQLFTRPDWPDEFTSLERPEVLRTLARLLGVSEFLWSDFLRMQYANLFPVIRNVEQLSQRKTKEQLKTDLATDLQAALDGESKRAALNEFKDREMFRIDMRHIQGHITRFGHFSAELTDLAEVVVEEAYRLCLAELEQEFGQPLGEDGQPATTSVCALGKCGGRELGFASDIELMFIFNSSGHTTGPRVITTAEFYEKVVQAVNQAIQSKREGIFELDLRLRPYGKAGSMAVSLDSFRRYFKPSGDAWAYERQALIKLRPICGDAALGQKVVKLRDELIYSDHPFDVAAMRAMRERQLRHLVTAGTTNAKFSPGGLVDIEYVVQGLQITHGHKNPHLRPANTREAMTALTAAGILSQQDYQILYEAHVFLRRLINALRMVRGHARDLTVPPPGSEEFGFLARRLNYGSELDRLGDDLTHHTTCVQEISQRLLEKAL